MTQTDEEVMAVPGYADRPRHVEKRWRCPVCGDWVARHDVDGYENGMHVGYDCWDECLACGWKTRLLGHGGVRYVEHGVDAVWPDEFPPLE